MPCRNPCRLYIHLAFTYSVDPSSVVRSELGPGLSFPPMRVLELSWSQALSLMCEVALRGFSIPWWRAFRRQCKVFRKSSPHPSEELPSRDEVLNDFRRRRRRCSGSDGGRVMAGGRALVVRRLGLVHYSEALALQSSLVERRRSDDIGDTLISLQHPPTFTVGKRRTLHNLLSSPAALASLGAQVHETERGGDITFHGPRQAVLYPILSLRQLRLGVRRYVEGLEDVMVKVCALHGVQARGRMVKETGVWVQDRKIGAIGVKVSSGSVTSHGLAFNVDPDLGFFKHIVPCGIADKEVTSLSREVVPAVPDMDMVTEELIQAFADQFGFEAIDELESLN